MSTGSPGTTRRDELGASWTSLKDSYKHFRESVRFSRGGGSKFSLFKDNPIATGVAALTCVAGFTAGAYLFSGDEHEKGYSPTDEEARAIIKAATKRAEIIGLPGRFRELYSTGRTTIDDGTSHCSISVLRDANNKPFISMPADILANVDDDLKHHILTKIDGDHYLRQSTIGATTINCNQLVAFPADLVKQFGKEAATAYIDAAVAEATRHTKRVGITSVSINNCNGTVLKNEQGTQRCATQDNPAKPGEELVLGKTQYLSLEYRFHGKSVRGQENLPKLTETPPKGVESYFKDLDLYPSPSA